MTTSMLLHSLRNISRTSTNILRCVTNKNQYAREMWAMRRPTKQNNLFRFLSSSSAQTHLPHIQSLTPSDDGQFVSVSWQDGHEMRYPYLWLRDNCRCSQCYTPQTFTRKFKLKDMDMDAKLKLPKYGADGSLVFHGTDGHETVIDSSWLRDRHFGEIQMGPHFEKIHWTSDLLSYLAKFQYDDVMKDDTTLYQWMKCVKVYGLAWIKGAPNKDKELRKLAERVGHLRQTFYGTIFGVKIRENTYFPGFTADEVALHTDYTFGYNKPGVFMLHCVESAPSGGNSRFVDGFKLADDLKRLDPATYELLCTGVLSFGLAAFDCGRLFDNRGQSPVISTNKDGSVDRITFSEHVRRDGLANIPLEGVPSFYSALKKFNTMAYSPEYLLQVMMEEGDIVTLDNYRVLHGRESFELQPGTWREIQGAYFDIDEFESHFRILSQQLSV